MTRDQLEHAIRAACDVAEDTELWVFGSQALLGSVPNAPPSLRSSIEVDVQPKNNPGMVDVVDGALGELSRFHNEFGFYVHGVSIDVANLSDGWQQRAVAVRDRIRTRDCTGWCLEVHDLAVSKLVAYRDKDREFVQTMMAEGLVQSATLLRSVQAMTVSPERRDQMTAWVDRTVRELES